MKKIEVAILGATGTVGQKLVALLESHPWFSIAELVASERSAGGPYDKVCHWRENIPLSPSVAALKVKNTDSPLNSLLLFSGLDSSVAGPLEERYAHQGHVVISNSKNHRMDSDVPLVIPEINASHLVLARSQPYRGAIITNANCSSIFLTMALAPLHQALQVKKVMVTTMQAISGAGYPGVPSLDILGNVIPHIAGEEEKIAQEPLKILGTLDGKSISPANFPISVQCNRVPVLDGHTESISIAFAHHTSAAQVKELLQGFRGEIAEMKLPSAPAAPLIVLEDINRPQSRDVHRAQGMSAIVGRIRACPVLDVRLVVLGHNTIRGAAGAAILNAELFHQLGMLDEYRL